MKHVASVLAVAALAVPAFAGSVSGSGSVSLFGVSYPITTWGISTDSNPSGLPASFGAEGMTFFGGNLYVSHDHDANRGDGKLVRYTPGAGGDLSAPTAITMGNGPYGKWGAEGITVNDSGSGFGSFLSGSAPAIAGVDTQGSPDFFGVFDSGNPGSVITSQVSVTTGLDDIAWVGSRNQFAAIEDGAGTSAFLRYFDHTSSSMTVTAGSTSLIAGAKGIATISANFAQLLTGLTITTAQALVVVSELEALAVYDTNGVQIGTTQSLSSYIPASGELESVAVDEANGLLFVGDEAGRAVHVLAIPAPGVAGLFGLVAVAGLRRRRA
jgi:hypothetical protein